MSTQVLRISSAAGQDLTTEIDLTDGPFIVEVQAELEGSTDPGLVGFAIAERNSKVIPANASPEHYVWLGAHQVVLRDQYKMAADPPKIQVMISNTSANTHVVDVRIVSAKVSQLSLTDFMANALSDLVKSQNDLLTRLLDILI